jgi:hypothetical protein
MEGVCDLQDKFQALQLEALSAFHLDDFCLRSILCTERVHGVSLDSKCRQSNFRIHFCRTAHEQVRGAPKI